MHQVEPALTVLVLGHETLRLPKPLREFGLREPGVFSDLMQDLLQLFVMPSTLCIPLHGLRHTHATLLMKHGVNPKVVAERLGHADITLTLSIYSHVLPQMQQEAANTFADAVKKRD